MLFGLFDAKTSTYAYMFTSVITQITLTLLQYLQTGPVVSCYNSPISSFLCLLHVPRDILVVKSMQLVW